MAKEEEKKEEEENTDEEKADSKYYAGKTAKQITQQVQDECALCWSSTQSKRTESLKRLK